jgi:phage gp36-like protein
MPYASLAELALAAGGEDRLLEMTDRDHDGIPDPVVIDGALTQADAFIDQYLSLRYATPIAAPSPVLRMHAAEHAIYWLRQSRGQVSDEENRQLENRQRQLEQMRDGRLRPDDTAPSRGAGVVAEFVERDPDSIDVSRASLRGFW